MTLLEQLTPFLEVSTIEQIKADPKLSKVFSDTSNIKFEDYSFLIGRDKKFELFLNLLKLKNKLDRYVILKEDEQGRCCEYAFMPGAPETNRCLSWYNKLQPIALERNGHKVEEWNISQTGLIYYLNAFTCGYQNAEGDEQCKPGAPCKRCKEEGCAKKWTFDEPVKCACWYLVKVDLAKMDLGFTIEEIISAL